MHAASRRLALLVALGACSSAPRHENYVLAPQTPGSEGAPAVAGTPAMSTGGVGAPSPGERGDGGAPAATSAAAKGGAGTSAGGVAASGSQAGASGAAQASAAGSAMSAGSAGASPANVDAAVASGATLPMVASVDGDGPFATKQDLASGPKQASGVFFPDPLGKDGLHHPIFLFGCGGGSTPSQYATDLSRIASHGFVVLADVADIGDDADVFRASLDWISAENGRIQSPFHDKLDTTRVAAGGHSIGSVNAFLFAPDPRLTATIHVAGGSLDNVNDPTSPTTGMGGKALVHPALFLCGDTDVFGNTEKMRMDYMNATAPVAFTTVVGSDHVVVFHDGLPAVVAFLRWQLGGETERRSMFLDPMGEFQSGEYMTRSKNF